jgi:hypothetical protein
LDEINLWAWRKMYVPDPVIFDGAGWSLSVSYPDRTVASQGANSFPDWREFGKFEDAVGALLGGRAFRLPGHVPNR